MDGQYIPHPQNKTLSGVASDSDLTQSDIATAQPASDGQPVQELKRRTAATSTSSSSSSSSSYGCSLMLLTVSLFSLIFLGCAIHSSFHHQVDPKGCTMTYMYPTYYRILGLDETITPLAGKYGLILYKTNYEEEPPVMNVSQLTQIDEYDWAIAKSAKVYQSSYRSGTG
jgi:hypothetical protein